MRLYRAVSEAEFEQLLETGRFQIMPGTLEGKFFAETPDHARQWGQLFGGPFHVIEIDLDDLVANQLMRIERLDGIGPARFARVDELAMARVRGEYLP
ncbi:MAG: hypothetical protein HZB53_20540 [Chloroflexi bacterium]|nr:hypothetical protein [Chloroflexota bacterium]